MTSNEDANGGVGAGNRGTAAAPPPVGNALDEVWSQCFQQDARKRPTALEVMKQLDTSATELHCHKRLRKKTTVVESGHGP